MLLIGPGNLLLPLSRHSESAIFLADEESLFQHEALALFTLLALSPPRLP